MNLAKGQLVRSMAGHDKGEYFLIYEIVDDNYVKIIGNCKSQNKKIMREIANLLE